MSNIKRTLAILTLFAAPVAICVMLMGVVNKMGI
tara:strand:- start:22095 stop:22196 length:102 start_codon:yes stop_codon:yes gene_type:complete